MLKLKKILPVFVVLLFLGLANTAFAQLSCSVSTQPATNAPDKGLTEPVGAVTFNCTWGANNTSAGTITVTYGTSTPAFRITNSVTYPNIVTPPGPISVTGNTCPGGAGNISVPAGNVGNQTGQVTVAVGAMTSSGAGTTCSFSLTGVLLETADKAGPVNANVSVSQGTGISIVAQQTQPLLIQNIKPGLVVGTTSPAILTTIATGVNTTFTTSVKEGYTDFFKSQAQFNGGNSTNGTDVLFTLSGIPTALTLTSCSASLTGGVTVQIVTPGTATVVSTISSTAPSVQAQITGVTNLNATESLTLTCTNFSVTAGTTTLPAGQITATATAAPTGVSFGGALGTTVLNTVPGGEVPRYEANPLSLGTVVNIIPTTTHMLYPFVTVGNGFDTGFAIANTSSDPYRANATGGGATRVSGSVTLIFYPQTGSAFCSTTAQAGSSSPAPTIQAADGSSTTLTCAVLPPTTGAGLDSTGSLASGKLWSVLGSAVLAGSGAGSPTTFNGYVFGIGNFGNGHSTVFVADSAFSHFAVGGPMLVVPNPVVTPRAVANGTESLGH